MHGHADWSAARASEIIAAEKGREGPLLPILHGLMDAFGYVPEPAVPMVAEALNLSRADVHGVVTFYHDLRRTPPVAHRVALCRGEACQARGAEGLYAEAADRWSATAAVEVGEVFCLGLCAVGPSGTVDGALHAGLSPDRLDALTDGWSR